MLLVGGDVLAEIRAFARSSTCCSSARTATIATSPVLAMLSRGGVSPVIRTLSPTVFIGRGRRNAYYRLTNSMPRA